MVLVAAPPAVTMRASAGQGMSTSTPSWPCESGGGGGPCQWVVTGALGTRTHRGDAKRRCGNGFKSSAGAAGAGTRLRGVVLEVVALEGDREREADGQVGEEAEQLVVQGLLKRQIVRHLVAGEEQVGRQQAPERPCQKQELPGGQRHGEARAGELQRHDEHHLVLCPRTGAEELADLRVSRQNRLAADAVRVVVLGPDEVLGGGCAGLGAQGGAWGTDVRRREVARAGLRAR